MILGLFALCMVADDQSRSFIHHRALDNTSWTCCQQKREKSPPSNMKGIRREPRHCCKTLSKPALCAVPCFEVYHMSEKLKSKRSMVSSKRQDCKHVTFRCIHVENS